MELTKPLQIKNELETMESSRSKESKGTEIDK